MSELGQLCDEGRQAARLGAWDVAFAQLQQADAAGSLMPADLDLLAEVAYLVGQDQIADTVSARAYRAWVEAGEPRAAARRAGWLCLLLLLRGEAVTAAAWCTRAAEQLGEEDVPERGYLLSAEGLMRIDDEPMEAGAVFARVTELGDRWGDPDLKAIGRIGAGQALIAMGRITEGITLLDEAMVSVTSGETSATAAGIAYCAVVETCRDVFDLRRARAWTVALGRWCDHQSGLMPYRGQCLVHRAEIMQLRGDWPEALGEATDACAQLDGQPAAGEAVYRLAELRRLRGEYDEADRGYREASRWIADPQPGLALLRLAQGRVDAAAAACRRALDEASDPGRRARLLGPYIEIMIAAERVADARAAADELRGLAEQFEMPMLHAFSDHANGACLLAEAKHRAALTTLRQAWLAWQELDAPYEAARVRFLTALAYQANGEPELAEMELDAAGWVFQQLGAAPDLQRVRRVSTRTGVTGAGQLTTREVEVLRLVATGGSNRDIALKLFLSEKTVARHLSNIFAKIGVTSRAAATAYAFQHELN